MRVFVVAATLAMGTALAVAPPASAANWQCAKTAHIDSVSGPGYMNIYGKDTPTGAKWHGVTMKRFHFYELHRVQVKVTYGGATEMLSGNAIVLLTCSGVSAGSPLDIPNLEMLRGTVVVHATHASPDTVSTEEGLFGPVPGSAAMVYRVHRSLADSALTLEGALAWYDNNQFQPTGTSKTKSESDLKVNVTPYVGADPGSCRQVDHAQLTTTKSFGRGTAVYDG